MRKTPPSAAPAGTPKNALNQIIELAKSNFCGEKMPYSLQSGLREFCREFGLTQKPFGLYRLNGDEVIFINESQLNPEQRNLFNQTRAGRTEAPFVFALKLGKIAQLPVVHPAFTLLDNSAVAN